MCVCCLSILTIICVVYIVLLLLALYLFPFETMVFMSFYVRVFLPCLERYIYSVLINYYTHIEVYRIDAMCCFFPLELLILLLLSMYPSGFFLAFSGEFWIRLHFFYCLKHIWFRYSQSFFLFSTLSLIVWCMHGSFVFLFRSSHSIRLHMIS